MHRIKSKNTQRELQELEKETSQPCWLFYILSPSCCMMQWSLNPLPLSRATTNAITDALLLNCNQFSYWWRIVWKEKITSASWHGEKPQLVQDWVLQYALSWAAAPSSSQANLQCGCPLTVLCSVKLQSPSLQSMVQTGLSISIHDLFDIKYVGRAFKKNGVLPLRVLMQFVSVTFCRQ